VEVRLMIGIVTQVPGAQAPGIPFRRFMPDLHSKQDLSFPARLPSPKTRSHQCVVAELDSTF
jgi:hypothetical protein